MHKNAIAYSTVKLHQETGVIILFLTNKRNTETDRSLLYGTALGIEGIELTGTYKLLIIIRQKALG